MSQWKNLSVLALLIAVLALTPGSPTAAQGSGACQTVAEAALAAVDTSCAGLGRDEACYGHTRVDAASQIVPVPETAGITTQAAIQIMGQSSILSDACTVTASSTVNLRAGPGTVDTDTCVITVE